MKVKLFSGLFALVLCMGAFLFPVTAMAAADSKPPSVNAWLTGDTMHIEATDDDSGVEAVYIDSHRFNYLVDGVIEVNIKDNNDGHAKISVYAVDFAGNKSAVVEIVNPHYKAPTSTAPPANSGTTPAPNPTQPPASGTQRPSSTPQPSTSVPTSSPAPSQEPTSSAVPDDAEPNPFTPEGQAEVVDNATEQDGKEFYTITTPEGNVFYIVIDRQRDTENVYLLNAVTEYDLAQLAEKGDGTSQSVIPTPEPTPQPEPTPEPVPTPEPEPEKPVENSNTGMIVFVLIAALAAGGAGYYFKILKPKQDAANTDDEFDEDYDDEYGDEMEYDSDPEDDYDDGEYEYPEYVDEPAADDGEFVPKDEE